MTEEAPRHEHTGKVRAYTRCGECLPVLYIENEPFDLDGLGSRFLADGVKEKAPWVEVDLLFERGRLTDVAPVSVESRAAIAASLEKHGLLVLRDEETIAKAHFRRRAKAK